jgi:hypothetical protein
MRNLDETTGNTGRRDRTILKTAQGIPLETSTEERGNEHKRTAIPETIAVPAIPRTSTLVLHKMNSWFSWHQTWTSEGNISFQTKEGNDTL